MALGDVGNSGSVGGGVVTAPTGDGCQSHATLAVVDATSDGMGYMLKPLKQKLFVDGLCYLLQEVYGLENKMSEDEARATFDCGRSFFTELSYPTGSALSKMSSNN